MEAVTAVAFALGVGVMAAVAVVVIAALVAVLVLRERHLLRRFEAADSVIWSQWEQMAGMKAHLLHLQGVDVDEDDDDDDDEGETWKQSPG